MTPNDYIIIKDATENNLKHVNVRIPKRQITVVTGVSGSGKSSLVLDTIAAKSRRELNDTFPSFTQQYLPKYGRPHVGDIENLPIAIVIEQRKPASNSRSTVGTYTDIYALLRLLFSRVGQPFVGYSDAFSFNHPLGSCPRCAGLGEIRELDIHKLVDFDKSLNDEDTIHYIAFGKGGWRWIRYAHSGLFDLDKKIKDYSPEELDLFLNSPQIKLKNPPSNWPKSAKYEGLIPRMYRSIINSEEGLLHAAVLNPMLTMGTCPDCKGTRLNEKIRSCKIGGLNIADVTAMSISDCKTWMETLGNPLAEDIKRATIERLSALEEIGLGYLTLDRAIGTLSGGEAQLAALRRDVYPRRAQRGPPQPRHPAHAKIRAKAEKPRQHGHPRGAPQGHDQNRRPHHRHGSWSGHGRRRNHLPRELRRTTSQPNAYRQIAQRDPFHQRECAQAKVVFPRGKRQSSQPQ